MTTKFLIVLAGQGDVEIKLANASAQTWIEDYTWGRQEQIPKPVAKGFTLGSDETTVYVSNGSGDNDRALACPGDSFSSIKDAFEYLQKHNLKLSGEFIGHIY